MVFPWFFLVFTLETARCGKPHHFPNGFPTSQVKSVAQPKPGAPPRVDFKHGKNACLHRKNIILYTV
jgi:hypothetical protein